MESPVQAKPECTNFEIRIKLDTLVKSQKCALSVIPAKLVPDSDPGAGIQCYQEVIELLDPVFQRGDDFLRMHQT